MITVGQITPDSPLGQFLTEQAGKAETIVEIGTGSGLGSTQCIAKGMGHFGKSILFTYEANHEQLKVAAENIFSLLVQGSRVLLQYGVIHCGVIPYSHPSGSPQTIEMWEQEESLARMAPLVSVPLFKIDLLLLDGGEYTSRGDWEVLKGQTRMVVLDDCNKEKAVKNAATYEELKNDPEWWCVADHIQNRNGWACFKRK
jgi:hypothetical protein